MSRKILASQYSEMVLKRLPIKTVNTFRTAILLNILKISYFNVRVYIYIQTALQCYSYFILVITLGNVDWVSETSCAVAVRNLETTMVKRIVPRNPNEVTVANICQCRRLETSLRKKKKLSQLNTQRAFHFQKLGKQYNLTMFFHIRTF